MKDGTEEVREKILEQIVNAMYEAQSAQEATDKILSLPEIAILSLPAEELIIKLKQIRIEHPDDEEAIHGKMDDLLLEYVNDGEVTRIFNLDAKWCA